MSYPSTTSGRAIVKDNDYFDKQYRPWTKQIVLGITAIYLAPIFLSMAYQFNGFSRNANVPGNTTLWDVRIAAMVIAMLAPFVNIVAFIKQYRRVVPAWVIAGQGSLGLMNLIMGSLMAGLTANREKCVAIILDGNANGDGKSEAVTQSKRESADWTCTVYREGGIAQASFSTAFILVIAVFALIHYKAKKELRRDAQDVEMAE